MAILPNRKYTVELLRSGSKDGPTVNRAWPLRVSTGAPLTKLPSQYSTSQLVNENKR